MALRVLGVDEAGRGALLGPMVVAGALVDAAALPELRKAGARDSKAVPRAKRREALREVLTHLVAARAKVIGPEEIDNGNLTELELRAVAELIRRLSPDAVVLDSPVSPRAIPGFRERLLGELGEAGQRLELHIAPRADRDHPAVGAASLLAKVTRDAYVAHLRRRYGEFGWGYPGEAATREFLLRWWDAHRALPPICRRRWATVGALLSPRLGI